MKQSLKTSKTICVTLPQDGNTLTMSVPPPARSVAPSVSVDAQGGYWTTVMALIAVDVVGLVTVVGTVIAVGHTTFVTWSGTNWVVYKWGLLWAGLLMACYAVVGLYRVADRHPAQELQHMVTTTLIVAGTGGGMAWLEGHAASEFLIALGFLSVVIVPGARILGRILLARTAWWGVPVIVLGSGDHGKSVVTTLKRWPELGFRPVTLLQDQSHNAPNNRYLRTASSLNKVPQWAASHDVPYAMIAMPELPHQERSKMVAHIGKFFRRLFIVPDGVGSVALWTTRSCSQGVWGFSVKHFRYRKPARIVKRLVDIVGATIGLVVLAPLFSAIAALIRIDSPGPVFFAQERMGMDGRCFTVYKFRTMYTDAEAKLQEILEEDSELRTQYEKYHKLDNDPRVTRIGKWLRRLSLDELPQLWNVLRGQMSLVGPRAYMPGELPQMSGLSRTVLQCPPGLTGLWQVSGRNNLDFSTRVELDAHYMQNWSPWLDFYILIRTIPVVLRGEGVK